VATDIPKADKANVKFFTMAYCPYGNQAESGIIPVYNLLKDKVTWEPHYVIYANYQGGGPNYCIANGSYCSMHGIQELNEDIREMCIFKYETQDKFFNFLADVNTACTSQNVDTCWEAVAKKYSIDTAKISQCQSSEGVALAKAEFELNAKYGVKGSPAVFINDAEYSGGRAAENYKAAICSGFNTPPSECSQSLGNATASNTAAGGCG
jgi:glutaredoxin